MIKKYTMKKQPEKSNDISMNKLVVSSHLKYDACITVPRLTTYKNRSIKALNYYSDLL